MNRTESDPHCPLLPELAEWFDGLLDVPDAERIEHHLGGCGRCRQMLLDWSDRVVTVAPSATAPASNECLDDELLVAYAVATTTRAPTTVAGVERHLRRCTRCVRTLQRTMRLQLQMEDTAADARTPVAAPEPLRAAASHPPAGFAGVASQWWESVRALFMPALWPRTAFAALGILVLTIGVSQFVAPPVTTEIDRVRDAGPKGTVEVSVTIAGYARPAVDEPVVVQLARGTRARWLETADEWTRIELADGRRVWVQSTSLKRVAE